MSDIQPESGFFCLSILNAVAIGIGDTALQSGVVFGVLDAALWLVGEHEDLQRWFSA